MIYQSIPGTVVLTESQNLSDQIYKKNNNNFKIRKVKLWSDKEKWIAKEGKKLLNL